MIAGTAPFDRPTLYSESNRVPIITGTGQPGSGGNIPQPVAVEPPLVGNPGFSVGVSNALGGAQAVLVIDCSDPGAGPNIPVTGSFTRRLSAFQAPATARVLVPSACRFRSNPALIAHELFWTLVRA